MFSKQFCGDVFASTCLLAGQFVLSQGKPQASGTKMESQQASLVEMFRPVAIARILQLSKGRIRG